MISNRLLSEEVKRSLANGLGLTGKPPKQSTDQLLLSKQSELDFK